MENVTGLLRVRVVRGVNLAKRDAGDSDAYVVVLMGDQVITTHSTPYSSHTTLLLLLQDSIYLFFDIKFSSD